MNTLLKIDELLLGDHFYLRPTDECYYLMEFMARAGYQHSRANNLIYNFKKPTKFQGHPAWRFKENAITQVGALLRQSLADIFPLPDISIVPIPPSKVKGDPEYDDRMLRAVQVWTQGQPADIRELFRRRHNRVASHHRTDRPAPAVLRADLELDPVLSENLRPTVVLVDDVLTAGTHFVVCKDMLLEKSPTLRVAGVFVARTIWPDPFAE